MTELEELVKVIVGDPDVVLGVDLQTMSLFEHPVAKTVNDLAAVGLKAEDRAVAPVKHEHVIVGINSYPGHLAQGKAIGQLRPTMNHRIRFGDVCRRLVTVTGRKQE